MTIKRLRVLSALETAATREFPEIAKTLTYAQWEVILSAVGAPKNQVLAWSLTAPFKNVGLLDKIGDMIEHYKNVFHSIAKDVGMSIDHVILAFRDRDLFSLLKAVKFNISALYKAIHAFTSLWTAGLGRAFGALANSPLGEKIRSGTATIDELLNAHPIIKKLSGPAIAGLMLYIWINGPMIGNFDIDMDITMVVAAFAGHYSVESLFGSANGMQMIALFIFKHFTGISFVWIAGSIANLCIALMYTGYKQMVHTPEVKDALLEITHKIKLTKIHA